MGNIGTFLFIFYGYLYCYTVSSNYVYRSYSHGINKRVKCGQWDWFNWWYCWRIQYETRYKKECMAGWTDLPSCNVPICGGNRGHTACSHYFSDDYIQYRDDSEERNSGGSCYRPNDCRNCNNGFYSTGSRCTICPRIPNCHYRSCTSPYDNTCLYCYYETKPQKYYRGYKYDSSHSACRKTCSWRDDSTLCFPGDCNTEFVESCKCTKGFTGSHCTKIDQPIELLFARSTFYDPEHSIAESPSSANQPRGAKKYWTNNIRFNKLNITFRAIYRPLGEIPKYQRVDHYVQDFKHGIIRGELKVIHIRDEQEKSLFLSDRKSCSHHDMMNPFPVQQEYKCGVVSNVEYHWDIFQHNDQVHISIELTNGGFVKYQVREKHYMDIKTRHLTGITIKEVYRFHWDTENPYLKFPTPVCSSIPVNVPDTTKMNNIKITWRNWIDDLSGIDYYEYEVYELHGVELKEDTKMTRNGTKIPHNSATFSVDKPGIYSVIFRAVDRATNHKTSRGLFLFDNESNVEIYNGSIIVNNEVQYLGKTWITFKDSVLHLVWKDRFINRRHVQNHWLNKVADRPDVEPMYDDRCGSRTTAEVTNINAVVEFKVAHAVFGQVKISSTDFTRTQNVRGQDSYEDVDWSDGHKVIFRIRAFDILGDYFEDNKTIYRDISPPVISNLWLTRGNRVNISIHSLEEFTHMTIEWDAYDYHSGISHLKWRLFDNFTGTDLVHGEEDMHGQGDTMELAECEAIYKNSPRGHSCYCTLFTGCYHKHFHVKPQMVSGGRNGLHYDKYKGVHDSDYYIEVTAINKASLETVHTIKITIDITPPEIGHVLDGLPGSPEVDFQQSLQLDVYWEGFVDHESGVLFYQYKFNTECLPKQYFLNNSAIDETYGTVASFQAPNKGAYFITVVAFNRALEMSEPVCSDGVTITTQVPSVRNILVKNAQTAPRLFLDEHGDAWYLDQYLQRSKIQNVTDSCRFSTLPSEDSSIFPISPYLANGTTLCKSMQYNERIKRVLPKIWMMNITWSPGIDKALIYDYEVGLSSTVDNPSPDILPFMTSKHHTQILLNHYAIPEGRQFFILIKSISKSNVIGHQSIGPYIMDTTAPRFIGDPIQCYLYGNILVANWTADSFYDNEEPYPLKFEYAIGHIPYTTDMQRYKPLNFQFPCNETVPATCTAINIDRLDWKLHGHHDYYISIKATNLAGLSVIQSSLPYRHDIQLPSVGVVIDVPVNSSNDIPLKDIEDIDYTDNPNALAARWTGFYHPHLNITYHACVGTLIGNCDTVNKSYIPDGATHYIFTSVILDNFQKYFVTIFAESLSGVVNTSSDGIMYANSSMEVADIRIIRGHNCSDDIQLNASHHNKNLRCRDDFQYQASSSSLYFKWFIPSRYLSIFTHAFWVIEERHWFGEFWTLYNSMEPEYISVHHYNELSINGQQFTPGRTHRLILRFCAGDICFPVVRSDGVTLIPNKPVAGSLSASHNGEINGTFQVDVEFDIMYDPDIVDEIEAREAIEYYEYALSDDRYGIYHRWIHVANVSVINEFVSKFSLMIEKNVDVSKIKMVHLRGYNKAGVWQTVATDIKKVSSSEIAYKRIIIDAVGKQNINGDGTIRDGIGEEIYLDLNGKWSEDDADYTPYKNILSAAWDSLRHHNYTYAVLQVKNLDSMIYYKNPDTLHLPEPCFHPDALRCGKTDKEYININFESEDWLKHGNRYIVCVHAPETVLTFETWSQLLKEVNECSDGVTVDLTPPMPGKAWIGTNVDDLFYFQTSTSDLTLSWESFTDVEELGFTSHSSGIREYMVAIGSVPGGTDTVEFTSVGLVNHASFHNLSLQNGHKYYGTVKGVDFTMRSAVAYTMAVTIDCTPPDVTSEAITIDGRHITNFTELSACWNNVFFDTESGIQRYLWGVGSKPKFDDVIKYKETTDECTSFYGNIDVTEGHAYFVNVKGVNKAGLTTTVSSWAYIYSKSPPYPGHVYDGFIKDAMDSKKDIDFQVDKSRLGVFWEGFHDPHLPIKYYTISIGTLPGSDDVLQMQEIGIRQNFGLKDNNLASGVKYFATVTACNTADLCTSVTSDGVVIDNSPPKIGIVQDGTEDRDINYQPFRNTISAAWFRFSDPQSGLERFVVRAGSNIGADDILEATDVQLTNSFVLTEDVKEIPLGKRVYVTVRAYNKAGLYSEVSTNGFIVDDTPPIITRTPELYKDFGSLRRDSIIFRSCLKVIWKVEDTESFIERQYISIVTHHGGDINSTSTQLSGIVREYTYTGLDLHDGGEYFVKLIVCNGAKLCSENVSRGFIVDNSRPLTGMFAIHTDHAASLDRHVPGWMLWSKYKLWLSLIGFSDVHTGIDFYVVSVGSSLMMDNLNKEGKPQIILHNDSAIHTKDEGLVQTFDIETAKLSDFEDVYISVWAVNKVGLKSEMLHHQFRLVPGGSLELIRRCTFQTCLGHCVCSGRGKMCPVVNTPCVDVTKGNKNALITISDIIKLKKENMYDEDYTPSIDTLAAQWRIVQNQGLQPQWYEWSVGITDSDKPEGVFDSLSEPVWHPCGQINKAIYNIPRGKRFTESVSYSFFVKVWYDSKTFAVFKSNGIMIVSKPLLITKIKGAGVIEQFQNHWKKDIDFIPRNALFTVNWTNAFQNIERIDKFHVYISTFPGGHDIHAVGIDIPGSTTSVNISRVPLLPGVRYYSNVVGYSYSGQHATLSSDGFVVDDDKPKAGIVSDGIGKNELDYQNKTDVVAATWHGFFDAESGISHYNWCVQSKGSKIECDIVPYSNVGIHRSVSRKINESVLAAGKEIVSKVFAVDLVGHKSDVVTSDGVTIDVTPPVPVSLTFSDDITVLNPSFEESSSGFVHLNKSLNITNDVCGYSVPLHWYFKDGDCTCVLGSLITIAMDGRSFLYVQGSVSQEISGFNVGDIFRITFVAANPSFSHHEMSNKEGFVQLGDQRHVFLLYTKQGHHKPDVDISWHNHTFYFVGDSNTMNLTFGSLNFGSGILLDNICISRVTASDKSHVDNILPHTVWINSWHSIHSAWLFLDIESPIVEYLWAIGYKEGSTEIQKFTSVGLNTFGYNYNITLAHTSQVHVTVVAINAAGLSTKTTAKALYIDLTPPVIAYVYDGLGYDVDSQTTDKIEANWNVTDDESGLSFCEWAVGYSKFGNEIQVFTKVSAGAYTVEKVFDNSLLQSKTVHVTVRCHNNAGLHTTASSDGVTISIRKPDIAHAHTDVIPNTLSEYPRKDNVFTRNSFMRLKWSGFVDDAALDSYIVNIEGRSTDYHLYRIISSESKDVMYCSIHELDLPDGNYSARIAAINTAFMESEFVTTNITILTQKPLLTEKNDIIIQRINRTIIVTWEDIFDFDSCLYYETSVGTFEGGANILQWQETTKTSVEMFIPYHIKLRQGISIYVTVTAIGYNGQSVTKYKTLIL